MKKLTKTTGEQYIRSQSDAQLAQFGHLNALITGLGPGTLKTHTGSIPAVALKTLVSNPYVLLPATGYNVWPVGFRYKLTTVGTIGVANVPLITSPYLTPIGDFFGSLGGGITATPTGIYQFEMVGPGGTNPKFPLVYNPATASIILTTIGADEPLANFTSPLLYALYYYEFDSNLQLV